MSGDTEHFIPALRFRWLTRFYDRVLAATLKEEKFKTLLLRQACIAPGHRVLDLGCGTGTLTLLAKRAVPEASVVGLDADPEALAIARRKAQAAGVDLDFREALAWDAPFPPGSFDRVLSSLVLHHLSPENKRRALLHVAALLRPGGELHVADWGAPHDALMRAAFLGVQLLDGFETTRDNVRGRIVPLMREAGFAAARETHRERSVFGTLSLYRAETPAVRMR